MKPEIRLRSFLRAAIVMLALFGLALPATAYDFSKNGIYYNIDSNTGVIVTYKDTNYNSYSGNVYIPRDVIYNGRVYRVVYIGQYAFRNCSGLTSVTMPYVCGIMDHAFYGCSSLTSLTIPESVSSIAARAFNGSSLTSVKVESGNSVYDSRDNCNAIIKTASNLLIFGCHNTIIPSSVTSINSYAFSGCTALTSVTIPNSVTSLGDWAFSNCTGLASVTIGSSVTSIGSSAFYGCAALTSVTIPNSVTSIGNGVFSSCIWRPLNFHKQRKPTKLKSLYYSHF